MRFINSFLSLQIILIYIILLNSCSKEKPPIAIQKKTIIKPLKNPFQTINITPFDISKEDLKKWIQETKELLLKKGINHKDIEEYISEKNLYIDPYIIAANLGYIHELKNSPLPGSSGNNPYNLDHQSFYKQFGGVLNIAHQSYRVPPQIVTSILWVETRFGANTGTYSVLNVYFNLSLLQKMDFLIKILSWLKIKYPDKFSFKLFKTASRRGQWGFGQLKTLLNLSKTLSLKSLKGSYAGAFGIPQFIPSSYSAYAKDGNGDGIINLFTMEDAIVSTANYLYQMGWTDEREKQYQAILAYNQSTQYANQVLGLAGFQGQGQKQNFLPDKDIFKKYRKMNIPIVTKSETQQNILKKDPSKIFSRMNNR